MSDNVPELGLKSRAVLLRAKAQEARKAPVLTKIKMAEELSDGVADFLVDLAASVERITPYIDEVEADAKS